MSRAMGGILAMLGACVIWGTVAILYKGLAEVPPDEVLAHRVLWSALLFLGILRLRGRSGEAIRLVSDWRQLGLTLFASAVISVNWLLFIYAVQTGQVVGTSLGYFIFPLVSVTLGAIFFGEVLSRLQAAAVALAGCGVVTLVLGLGVVPWISLSLAGSFGLYGVAKKLLRADATVSVAAEVLVLLPIALWWLWKMVPGWGAFEGWTALMLIATGPATSVPLMLFTIASQRISMASLGIIGYLNPLLQFFCATVLFGEVFTPWHAFAFALIWTALALYSGEAILSRRRVRAARQ